MLFLAFLVQSVEPYNEREKKIDENGFFMIRRSYIQSRIGLTPKIQERVTYDLAEKNLVQYEVRNGMPPSGWIKLNHSAINVYLKKSEKDKS